MFKNYYIDRKFKPSKYERFTSLIEKLNCSPEMVSNTLSENNIYEEDLAKMGDALAKSLIAKLDRKDKVDEILADVNEDTASEMPDDIDKRSSVRFIAPEEQKNKAESSKQRKAHSK